MDRTKEEASWNNDLKEELEEIFAEKTEEYNSEIIIYNQKFKAHKLQLTRKVITN